MPLETIRTFKMGGSCMAGAKVFGSGGNEALDMSAPSSTALNKFVDFEVVNNSQEEDFDGNSKSRNNFVMDPMV